MDLRYQSLDSLLSYLMYTDCFVASPYFYYDSPRVAGLALIIESWWIDNYIFYVDDIQKMWKWDCMFVISVQFQMKIKIIYIIWLCYSDVNLSINWYPYLIKRL